MKTEREHLALIVGATLAFAAIGACASGLHAQEAAAAAISVKGHHFQPAQIKAPANRPLSIRVTNFDAAAMEFESVSLRVEKVIASGGSGIVSIRPLSAGRYEFYDDFHQQTRGTLVVR